MLGNQQAEPNIDDLLTIVKESVEAFKVCKDRIDAVEKALQQTLTDASLETTGRSQSVENSASGRAESNVDPDEEIPF